MVWAVVQEEEWCTTTTSRRHSSTSDTNTNTTTQGITATTGDTVAITVAEEAVGSCRRDRARAAVCRAM